MKIFKNIILTAALTLPVMASTALAKDVTLPKTMLWSTYDVGSSGYAQASAIADAFGKTYGTRIRIKPSGTSIGRLLPLKTGRVQYGWLANELYFASEALFDFSAQEWGPQDLRVLAGRPSTFGMATAADSGINSIAELKGKRLPRIKGNPSINIKIEAMLAFGGLTWDDVQVVEMPSYGSMLRALVNGQVDAVGSTTTASTLYEMESSPHGVKWIPMPPGDKDAWKNITDVASFFAPVSTSVGAGLGDGKTAEIFSVRYPMISVYADSDEDEVYNFTKALDETYKIYSGATAAMPAWEMKRAGRPPVDAPFHPGAIRYLKEIKVWTAEDDAWNNKRLARLKAVMAAWEEASDKASEMGLADKKWAEHWAKYREKALK